VSGVRRAIVGFDTDETGDWVALLECGHRQHVRHRPPWQERPWVLSVEGRKGRIGSPLVCVECDRRNGVEVGEDAGGDPACLAHRVCAECGAVVDPGRHRPGCAAGR
jgi:hypothetical protein